MSGEVSLSLGESVWLRGLGAELALEGELVAKKQRHEPAGLHGNVEVASGRVDFQSKWLRVTSGNAIFDGSPDPDPFIDATAIHRVTDVTIFVRLRGRASDLQVELDSEPPMPVEDQISYLLFNRPTSEISAEDQQNISAAAVAASDLLLGRFGTEIAQEVGLDRVRIGVDEEDAPVVEVEKWVHERVTVRYGRSFGGGGGSDRIVIEWRLFRSLFLAGEQSTSGDSAVDVFWRTDY
jgi:translocation and assembly module TamB